MRDRQQGDVGLAGEQHRLEVFVVHRAQGEADVDAVVEQGLAL